MAEALKDGLKFKLSLFETLLDEIIVIIEGKELLGDHTGMSAAKSYQSKSPVESKKQELDEAIQRMTELMIESTRLSYKIKSLTEELTSLGFGRRFAIVSFEQINDDASVVSVGGSEESDDV